MIKDILNIKLRMTHYFIMAYIMYALFGTVFFRFYPCKYFDSNVQILNFIDIFGDFPLIDQVALCPTRRKLALIYMWLGADLFGILTLIDYIVFRDLYLNEYITERREQGIRIFGIKTVMAFIVAIVFVGCYYIGMLFIFPYDLEVDEISRKDVAFYSDSIYSFYLNFTGAIPLATMSLYFVILHIDLILSYFLGDIKNES